MAALRVNVGVVAEQADAETTTTLDNIDGEQRVTGALGVEGVEGRISALRQRVNPPACAVDLIAHAYDGVLVLGSWVIDAGEQAGTALQARLGAGALSELRLLGCSTSRTAAGQAAMLHLAAVFQIPIFGTTVPLYSRDFGPSGLISPGVLEDHGNLIPIEAPFSDATVGSWFERFAPYTDHSFEQIIGDLIPETLDEIRRKVKCAQPPTRALLRLRATERAFVFGHLAPRLATAPGLLALPEAEVLFPVDPDPGATRFHRLTIFFGGRFVRLYPRAAPRGVIVHTTSALQLPAGVLVPITPAHHLDRP